MHREAKRCWICQDEAEGPELYWLTRSGLTNLNDCDENDVGSCERKVTVFPRYKPHDAIIATTIRSGRTWGCHSSEELDYDANRL